MKVRKAKWLVILMVMVMMMTLLPAVAAALTTDKYQSDTTTMVISGNVPGVYPYAAVPANAGTQYGVNTWINQTGSNSWDPVPTWIWESMPVIHPIAGDIVWFEKTFVVGGIPTAGQLKIACDNGYAVWLNGKFVGKSDTLFQFVGADNDYNTAMLGDLKQPYLDTTGWATVGVFDLSLYLLEGNNVLTIMGVNEYFNTGDGSNNELGTTLNNPGGLAFSFTVDWELPPTYEISGYKYNDDTGLGIQAWTVELFKKNVITLEYDFFATTNTDADGKYTFAGLLAGDYRVVEEQRAGWDAITQAQHDVSLPLQLAEGEPVPTYNFRNAPLYEIEGFKYRTGTDIPLGGWTIELREVNDNESVQTRVTDINGYYKFTGLRAGNYEVTEVQKTGWTQTSPVGGKHTVILPSAVAGPIFYNFHNEPEKICYDDTIWAFGGALAKANNTVTGNSSNNWGWTNQITVPGEYEFVLYRGAGGNDIEKGTPVGTLFVSYVGTTATITYSVDEPYTLSEVHLWVGKTPLPVDTVKTGRRTTTVVSSAPGQLAKLGYSPEIIDGTSATQVVTITAPFWVAAHGVVDWCEIVAADEAIYYHWGPGYPYGATADTYGVAMVTTYSIETWWLVGDQWIHDIYSPVAFTDSTTYTVASLNEPLKAIHEKHFPGLVTTNYTRTNIDVSKVPVPNAASTEIPPLPTP